MKKLIIAFFVLTSSSVQSADFSVYEANYPNVKDFNVNLEQAFLTVSPRGAYVEMNLELVVSYDFSSWFFKNYTELEFLWNFSLPDQACIHDFWIWHEDTVLQATMLDRWTAELLFSEVSSPVRNPGLLTQSFPDREGQVHYQLRLYPVMRNVKRKLKIQYFLPARPTNETLRIWLPTSQLTSRKSPGLDSLHVIFKSDQQPTLLGADILSELFSPGNQAWEYTIRIDYDQFVELIYPTPIKDNFFFSTFKHEKENFYQLAVYPPKVVEEHKPRNFVLLFDFNRYNTKDLDGELILLHLKETMQQALTTQDSANIMVGFEDVTYGANKLLPCSENQLDSLFINILKRSFPAYSNLQILISSAADFAYRSSPLEIILLTNTDEINQYYYSMEAFAAEIIDMFPKNTKIHVVDLENKSRLVYNHLTNQYEAQLFSFYAHMCNNTGGNLFFLRYHSIKNILASLFYEKISHFKEVEVQTRFANGYAYGKHLIALHQGYYPLRFPIIQVGRFAGNLPLEVTVLGKVRLDKTVDTLNIFDSDIIPGNKSLKTAWYGDHIRELLGKSQSNLTVQEITDLKYKAKNSYPLYRIVNFSTGR
ncbi:hypothetical protein H8E88_18295 [candidate division KSB1 bacterium]|nr:hypothetical protein [candidate division KSB1 bacterium]